MTTQPDTTELRTLEALLERARKQANMRSTPSGPFIWSISIGELEQIAADLRAALADSQPTATIAGRCCQYPKVGKCDRCGQ